MKSRFSELSYAFALTDNLIRRIGYPTVSAPTFPSTAAEGKKGGGYDLKLSYPGAALFLQFKLSEQMSSKSALEFKKGAFPQMIGGVKAPVYRFYLRPLKYSRQTSLMLKLEKRHQHVYYVAPLFHTLSELNQHYADKRVDLESRFLKPSIIKKMPDKQEHFVSFRKSGKPWRFSVEPTELEGTLSNEDLVAGLRASLVPDTSLETVITKLLVDMRESIIEDADDIDGPVRARVPTRAAELAALEGSDLPLLAQAEFLARTYFDAHLLTFVAATKDQAH